MEPKVLAEELAQGLARAIQLRLHLSSTSTSGEAEDMLLLSIISSFEKALCFLKWSGDFVQAPCSAPCSAPPKSSEGSGSVTRDYADYNDRGDASKKRKVQTTWTEQVRVVSENGLEGPGDDGHSWRKYGQKDILGAKYPRSYYRCTYRLGRKCWATKQVQRSDEDPMIFDVTYKGTHTCKQFKNTAPPPASSEKQEPKRSNSCYDHLQQNPMLSNFRSNLRVGAEASDIQEKPACFSFPSTFAWNENDNHFPPISPLADYVSNGTYRMGDYGGVPMQHSEGDIADIMSADASTTNSPIGGMEFSIPVEIDPDFPFDISGFFT